MRGFCISFSSSCFFCFQSEGGEKNLRIFLGEGGVKKILGLGGIFAGGRGGQYPITCHELLSFPIKLVIKMSIVQHFFKDVFKSST